MFLESQSEIFSSLGIKVKNSIIFNTIFQLSLLPPLIHIMFVIVSHYTWEMASKIYASLSKQKNLPSDTQYFVH